MTQPLVSGRSGKGKRPQDLSELTFDPRGRYRAAMHEERPNLSHRHRVITEDDLSFSMVDLL
jgi:hypothetical protein